MGLGKVAHTADEYLSWDPVRPARSQAPCFFLLPTRHSTLFLSPLVLVLLRKYFFGSYMVEEKRNNLEGSFKWASLSLEFSSKGEHYSQRLFKRASLPLTSLLALSAATPSFTGLASLALQITACWAQSRMFQIPEPNTTKSPADSKVYFPVKVSRTRDHHWRSHIESDK